MKEKGHLNKLILVVADLGDKIRSCLRLCAVI